MALVCRQEIQKVSLREMESQRGIDKYHAFMKLESVSPKIKSTGEKAIQRVMIALDGYASEILFSGGSTNIGGDDLTVAEPGALDMIENPQVRAYIDHKLHECVKVLDPRFS